MEIIIFLSLIILGLTAVITIWIYRLVRLFKSGQKRRFTVQISIVAILIFYVAWKLQLIPPSKNFYIMDQMSTLTGRGFWNWEEYDYYEVSVRGEGYTLYIHKFNQETAEYFKNPDTSFFTKFPSQNDADIKWTPTPVRAEDIEILTFVTPVYGGWKGEIVSRQDFIRDIAKRDGAYYAYKQKGSTDFYLISPKDRLIILINHNM